MTFSQHFTTKTKILVLNEQHAGKIKSGKTQLNKKISPCIPAQTTIILLT